MTSLWATPQPKNELFVFLSFHSEVDMRLQSSVWSVVNSRLEELLKVLNSDSSLPEALQTLSALEGLAVCLHLAAFCSSATRCRNLSF